MNSIAIITARGGSKRIPQKNIKSFCGKPIIAYSIEAALKSGVFDEVMVSTDSKEIADIARDYGASVPFMRSKENSDDFSTTSDVLVEVLNEYKQKGYNYKYACCLYPTAPFVTEAKLRDSMMILEKKKVDSVVSMVSFSYPPQRALIKDEGGLAKMLFPEFADKRSQDLEEWLHDAGQFYCFNVDNFFKTKKIMLGKIIPYELSELEVQDIDTEVDWTLAELKYQLMLKGQL